MPSRKRGRPVGSGRPATELRPRKDYRFSPETLLKLKQGQQLAGTTETAFIEAAIGHYVSLLSEAAYRPMPTSDPLPAHNIH